MINETVQPNSDKDGFQNRISIQYSGILATQLDWNKKRIGEVMKAADLRSQLTIRSRRQLPSYDSDASDIIVLPQANSQSDSSQKARLIDERAVITPQLDSRRITITFNDQIIANGLKDSRKDWNRRYVDELNMLTAQSLGAAIFMEKSHQVNESMQELGEINHAVYEGLKRTWLLGTFGTAAIYGGARLVNSAFDTQQFKLTIFKLSMGIIPILQGGTLASALIVPIDCLKMYKKEIDQYFAQGMDPYLASWNDIVTPTHLMSLTAGNLSLIKPSAKYVSLKEKVSTTSGVG